MANVLSANYSAQLLALSKGPGRGVAAPTSGGNLRFLTDKASIPVGAPAVATATDYIRFMKLPKGAVIHRNLCYLSTNHTATIAGKLQLVPLDGSAVQEITGVTANLEATETTSVPDAADDVVVAADSWVQFVPGSDLTIASTAKDLWLRIGFSQTY